MICNLTTYLSSLPLVIQYSSGDANTDQNTQIADPYYNSEISEKFASGGYDETGTYEADGTYTGPEGYFDETQQYSGLIFTLLYWYLIPHRLGQKKPNLI